MRKRNTELLRDVITQVLKQNKLDKPLNEKHIIDAWPVVLGHNINQYTSALEVRQRVLYVTLTSWGLRHDLFLSKDHIMNSLNKHVGAEVIKNIVFK
jgi:predicted nucleic acid-binding Zn ribbon protein